MPRYGVYTDVSAASANLETRLTALTNQSTPVYNVKAAAYGAVGNGVTDDRAAIQLAIDAAVAAGGGTVYFPPGTYALTTYAPTYTDRILRVNNDGSAVAVHLVGAPGAILTTALNTNTNSVETQTLRLSGALEDCVIEGLDFRNTHGLTAGRTMAIVVSSSTNAVKRLTIRRNIFRNHARTLHMQGVETLWVERNRFLFTNGRDSGNTNLADPNVCLWCLVSADGQTSDVYVTDNWMDGCTSGTVASNTNKQGLDGLVYGVSRGWTITGNRGKRWGTEFIYISSRQAYEATRFPAIIANNSGDGTVPTGATPEQIFGIRSDEHDTKSANNNLKAVHFGIDITGSGRAAPLEGCTSENDQVTLTGATSEQYGIQFHTCNAPDIKGARVQWTATPATTATNLYGVKLFQCHRGEVSDVSIRAPALPSAGTSHGVYVQQTHSARFNNIRAEYMTYGLFEYQHTTSQPGNRIMKLAARNCTNIIGGANADVDQMVIEGWEDPMSANNGDASVTLRGYSLPIQRFDTALTANRTVTVQGIDGSGQSDGKYFRIVRTGLGAFTLTVQDHNAVLLKTIPSATAAVVEVMFDGSNWKLIGYQTL